MPYIFSPLSVNTNSSGKKRLALDLRYVNLHLFKERISFRAREILEAGAKK